MKYGTPISRLKLIMTWAIMTLMKLTFPWCKLYTRDPSSTAACTGNYHSMNEWSDIKGTIKHFGGYDEKSLQNSPLLFLLFVLLPMDAIIAFMNERERIKITFLFACTFYRHLLIPISTLQQCLMISHIKTQKQGFFYGAIFSSMVAL